MVSVFDPYSLWLIREIDLAHKLGFVGHRSIAVNTEGHLYIVDWEGDLMHLDPDGNLMDQVNLCELADNCNLIDIDVSQDNLLVIGGLGNVAVVDDMFSSISTIAVDSGPAFVSITPIPVPGSIILLVSGLVWLKLFLIGRS